PLRARRRAPARGSRAASPRRPRARRSRWPGTSRREPAAARCAWSPARRRSSPAQPLHLLLPGPQRLDVRGRAVEVLLVAKEAVAAVAADRDSGELVAGVVERRRR